MRFTVKLAIVSSTPYKSSVCIVHDSADGSNPGRRSCLDGPGLFCMSDLHQLVQQPRNLHSRLQLQQKFSARLCPDRARSKEPSDFSRSSTFFCTFLQPPNSTCYDHCCRSPALVATYIMADSSNYDGIDDPGLKPSSPSERPSSSIFYVDSRLHGCTADLFPHNITPFCRT